MASFTPTDSHIIRSCKRMLLKLPQEIRMMIYELCMSTDAGELCQIAPTSSPPTYPPMMFHMREVYEGDIAAHHHLDDDSVYHKNHKACDWDHWDGEITSYSIVMLDDDPNDLPPQVEEWMSTRDFAEGPCDC